MSGLPHQHRMGVVFAGMMAIAAALACTCTLPLSLQPSPTETLATGPRRHTACADGDD